MTRLEQNKAILKLIEEWIEFAPEQRFMQALANLNIEAPEAGYYKESDETLAEVSRMLKVRKYQLESY